jgi:hypothetical protein
MVRQPYRVFTVSKPWVTVTAPQAAMPPAMKAPAVVDIVTQGVCVCVSCRGGGGWQRRVKLGGGVDEFSRTAAEM